jgi:hypothetical protein
MLSGQKCPKMHVFAPFKLMGNHLKGVKMNQNPSKPWSIVHAFWSKMDKNACFLHLLNYSKII